MRAVLTEEQQMLLDAVRDTLEGEAPLAVVRAWMEDRDASEFEKRFAAGGWYGVGLPEEDGGHGGDFSDVVLIAEELGRAAAPSGAWTGAATVAPALAGLPDLTGSIAEGSGAALAIDSGVVPSGGLAPTARLDDGLVTGRVPHVLAADRASALVLLASDGDGSSIVVVPTSDPCVKLVPHLLLDRTRTIADVHLDGARASRVEVGDVAGLWQTLGDRAAVLTAADSLGASQRLLEMTVAYTQQREQFGGPIARFQAVKHSAATMLVDIEPLRSVVRDAARAIRDGDGDASLRASVAATHAGEVSVRVAEKALMLHGAIGFTWEHDLQLLYKRAKLNAQLYGSGGAWRDRTADLLGLTRAAS